MTVNVDDFTFAQVIAYIPTGHHAIQYHNLMSKTIKQRVTMKIKHFNSRLLAMSIALMATMSAMAYDFEQDGIYYSVIGPSQVSVDMGDQEPYAYGNTYSGNVVIPSTVVHDNVSYTVTAVAEAFFGCVDLHSVTIPATITELYWDGFTECAANIFVPDLETWCRINFHIDCAFTCHEPRFVVWSHKLFTGQDIEHLVIPSTVTDVHDYCFYKTELISSVEIPDQVTTIGKGAFAGCLDLKSVKIGPNVTFIGNHAFDVTTSFMYWFESWCEPDNNIINDVTCLATVPPTLEAKECFTMGTYKHSTLYVPAQSIRAYCTDENWGRFENILPIPSVPGDVDGNGKTDIGDVSALIDMILNG